MDSIYCVVSSYMCHCGFFFFKQKTAYEMRISDWSSDVCSSDLAVLIELLGEAHRMAGGEMQLARGFLLKRGGGEGRLRIARLRLGFDRGDTETACFHICPGGMEIGRAHV